LPTATDLQLPNERCGDNRAADCRFWRGWSPTLWLDFETAASWGTLVYGMTICGCSKKLFQEQVRQSKAGRSLKNSGRACKPDSVRCTALQQCFAAIIPLGRGSHHSSSSLPEGFQFSRLTPQELECALHERISSSRASSPLLFGLAPRGVFRAPGIAAGAVGSYPTFSPLPTELAFRRRLAGFPA
jgi:hypothetical protein